MGFDLNVDREIDKKFVHCLGSNVEESNSWPCPDLDGAIMTAMNCFDFFMDALNCEEPDETCLSCQNSRRAIEWKKRELQVKSGKVDTKTNVHKLADDHWKYIVNLLAVSMPKSQFLSTVEMASFHYKTAFVHGYKHGQEDVRDA